MATTDFDLDAYLDAWKRRDVDAIVDHYADDVTFHEPGSGTALRGRDAVRGHVQELLNGFDGMDAMEVRAWVQAENVIAWLVRGTATHRGDTHLAGGVDVPATGKRFELHFADFMELDDDGHVRSETLIFDTADMLRQLGVAPEALGAHAH